MDKLARRNATLVEALLAGDPTARDEIILLNRPLVLATVRRMVRSRSNCRHPIQDLVGVGLVALVIAVDRLIEKNGLNQPVRNYLITAIRSRVKSELWKQRLYYQHHQHVPFYDSLPEATLALEDTARDSIDNTELFFSFCQTERQKQVLEMYLQGCPVNDIAITIGTSRQTIYKFLRHLRRKVEKMWRS